jgi:hypothetical protein
MTTPGDPDFVVGVAEELRPSSPGAAGGTRTAKANVGHAVTPENVREGGRASPAICGKMTTVSDPPRPYNPRSSMAYGHCHACAQRVTAAR